MDNDFLLPSRDCVEKVKCFRFRGDLPTIGNAALDTDSHALSARGSNSSSGANPSEDEALKLFNTAQPRPYPCSDIAMIVALVAGIVLLLGTTLGIKHWRLIYLTQRILVAVSAGLGVLALSTSAYIACRR